jgi:hypothetical protein
MDEKEERPLEVIDGREEPPLEVTDDEIKENFKLLTQRPITQRTISVGKCIAHVAQWHVIEAVKFGLLPLRVGNYYLIKTEALDKLFAQLDKRSIEQAKKRDD